MNPADQKLRKAIFKAFRGKCFWSGRVLQQTSFHIDHVIPFARGDKDEIENFVLADPQINLDKSDLLNDEFVIPVLYIVRTVYAPRVRYYLEQQQKNIVAPKKQKKVTGRIVRMVSEDSFKQVWGLGVKDVYDHIVRTYDRPTIKIFG